MKLQGPANIIIIYEDVPPINNVDSDVGIITNLLEGNNNIINNVENMLNCNVSVENDKNMMVAEVNVFPKTLFTLKSMNLFVERKVQCLIQS